MSLSPLAEALRAFYHRGDVTALHSTYLHRARRRHGGTILSGREAILATYLEDAAHLSDATFSIETDLGDVVSVAWVKDGKRTRRHYWPNFEQAKISVETIIDNASHRHAPPRDHIPLGELNSGGGQTGPAPLPNASPIAQAFHALWNHRALSILNEIYAANATYSGPKSQGNLDALRAWRLAQFNDFPQSHVTIEKEVLHGDHVALLWQWGRINRQGMRDRVTGSTIFTLADGKICHEDTLIDQA